MAEDFSRLKRQKYAMPGYIEQALIQSGLMGTYKLRPPYQQNDYIGWITRAKQEITRQKRLEQMLEELRKGDAYMKMPYKAKK